MPDRGGCGDRPGLTRGGDEARGLGPGQEGLVVGAGRGCAEDDRVLTVVAARDTAPLRNAGRWGGSSRVSERVGASRARPPWSCFLRASFYWK